MKEEISGMKEEISELKDDMSDVKVETKRLHHFDLLILDEVERVHEILNMHRADRSVHYA